MDSSASCYRLGRWSRGPRSLAALLILGIPLLLFTLSIAWIFPVRANPLPDAMVFTHVQPYEPDFCSQTTITTCEQIVQYTTERGLMEFDIFIYPLAHAGQPVYAFESSFGDWPADWQLLSTEICSPGEGTIEVIGRMAVLDLVWPTCPTPPPGEVMLACRFVFDAPTYGGPCFCFSGAFLTHGCPPNTFTVDAYASGAKSGIECAYCYTDCGFEPVCRAVLYPDEVTVEVVQGEILQEQITSSLFGGAGCVASYDATEPWMELIVEPQGSQSDLLTVTIDTAGLDPGLYSGYVRGQSDCAGCTRVVLTVNPVSQGVSERDPEDPGGQGIEIETSWGRLKGQYR